MRTLIVIGLALTFLGSPTFGQALRCPIGFHRDLVGRCRPNFVTGVRRGPSRMHHPHSVLRPQGRP